MLLTIEKHHSQQIFIETYTVKIIIEDICCSLPLDLALTQLIDSETTLKIMPELLLPM